MNKRKKGLCQLLACAMVLVMLVSLSPVNVQAASKVKINKTKTTMYVGTPKTLKITGTTKKVTWKSSNKKIATVSAKGRVSCAGKVKYFRYGAEVKASVNST